MGSVVLDAAVAVDRSRDASVNVLGRDIRGSSLRHAHLTLSQRGSLLFLHLLPRPTPHQVTYHMAYPGQPDVVSGEQYRYALTNFVSYAFEAQPTVT